jgi:hypothetical protein
MPNVLDMTKRMRRQVTACALIYALVLQGIIVALAGAGFAETADSRGIANYEICHHDGGVPDAPSQAPDQSDNSCCILCLAGANYTLADVDLTIDFRPVEFAAVRWPATTLPLPAHTVDANTRPRGPPAMA